ncbi:hypothetical protein FRB96_005513 [Tulasnella sp. 330]|nr:hypothetical protein FRB96_005513 [Tulasnella sp. 330]
MQTAQKKPRLDSFLAAFSLGRRFKSGGNNNEKSSPGGKRIINLDDQVHVAPARPMGPPPSIVITHPTIRRPGGPRTDQGEGEEGEDHGGDISTLAQTSELGRGVETSPRGAEMEKTLPPLPPPTNLGHESHAITPPDTQTTLKKDEDAISTIEFTQYPPAPSTVPSSSPPTTADHQDHHPQDDAVHLEGSSLSTQLEGHREVETSLPPLSSSGAQVVASLTQEMTMQNFEEQHDLNEEKLDSRNSGQGLVHFSPSLLGGGFDAKLQLRDQEDEDLLAAVLAAAASGPPTPSNAASPVPSFSPPSNPTGSPPPLASSSSHIPPSANAARGATGPSVDRHADVDGRELASRTDSPEGVTSTASPRATPVTVPAPQASSHFHSHSTHHMQQHPSSPPTSTSQPLPDLSVSPPRRLPVPPLPPLPPPLTDSHTGGGIAQDSSPTTNRPHVRRLPLIPTTASSLHRSATEPTLSPPHTNSPQTARRMLPATPRQNTLPTPRPLPSVKRSLPVPPPFVSAGAGVGAGGQ